MSSMPKSSIYGAQVGDRLTLEVERDGKARTSR